MEFLVALVVVLFLIWLVKSVFWAIVIIVLACLALALYRWAISRPRL